MKQTRRKFLATAATGAIAAAAAPLVLAEEKTIYQPVVTQGRTLSANDRIRIAIIGVNSRGKDHIEVLMKIPNVEVATLCDPDMRVLRDKSKWFEDTYKKKVAIEQDFRKVFDDKNIDAVTIASPNFWHALHAIYACQAGKDVYWEKPGTHNISEGKKVIEAAYKYNRIVQHGVQLRSSVAIREAIQHLRNGLIGRVYMARGLVFRWRPDIGNKGVSKVPDELNYDLWCGPAPMAPFTENLVHYNWHWHWNYGNGDIANQGVHETDLCMWGLDVGLPEHITSMGGKYLWDDTKEVPEIMTSVFNYPKEKKIIQFEVRHWCTNREDGADVGNIFYGDKGYLVVKNYGTYESYLGQNREKGPARTERGELDLHMINWLDAVRARDKSIQHGPVESGHLSSALAHLGNISYRLGRQLNFDPVSERFIGDDDANAMLTRQYRAPFLMPEKI
jgi:predicted dehydrogenase